jgi:hypothetical protein
MRRTSLVAAPIAIGALFALGVATEVQASSCVSFLAPWNPPNDPTTMVFVGTVADTQTFEQNALFHVEEVWYGGPVPEYIAGIQSEPNQIFSTSVLFQQGDRYVVVGRRDGELVRIGCDTVQPYTRYLEVRKDQTQSRVSEPTPSDRPLFWGVEGRGPGGLPFILLVPLTMVAMPLLTFAGTRAVCQVEPLRGRDYILIGALAGLVTLVSLSFWPLT